MARHGAFQRRGAATSSFWTDHIGRKAAWQFFAAVVTLFSLTGILFEMAAVRPAPWPTTIVWGLWTGLVAAGWAYGFTHDRRVLPFVVPASFLMPRLLGASFWVREPDPHRLLCYFISLGIIIASYVAFIHFISTEATRSMRMSAEMRLAKDIHESLVPPIGRSTPRIEIRGRSDPTTEVGGDLLDAVDGADRDAVFIADVTGHGVPAGVLMAMVKSAIRVQLRAGVELERLVGTVNAVLHDDPARHWR